MLNLNGVKIPSFVKVNKIDYSLLPPINNNFATVRGKKGIHLFKQTVGERIISVDVTIIGTDGKDVVSKARQLAEWLYHEEAVQLITDDEPDKYYLVVPDGETRIDEIVSIGQGTISFLCTEPFAISTTEKSVTASPLNESPFNFTVGGTTETFPKVQLTMKQDAPVITLISDNGQVMIGEPNSAEQTVANPSPLRLHDQMGDVTLWTSASAVDEGDIQGTFTSNGYSFSQTNKDYGLGSKWKGASVVRSLPSAINDFRMDAEVGLLSNHGNNIGRVQVYLLDANNVQFGVITLRDAWNGGNTQTFEARGGQSTNGKWFVKEYRKDGVWTNFEGILRLTRKGRNWSAYIGHKMPDGTYNRRLTGYWNDVNGIATNQLAKIQIHVSAHSNYTPMDWIYISDIKVYEYVELTTSQAPIRLGKGDVLQIDCEKSIVYKNGEPFYEGINPITEFFSLQKGTNGLAISPAIADVKVTFRERWL